MKYIKILFIVLIILLFAIIYTQNLDVFTHDFQLQLDLKTHVIGPYVTKNVVIILAAFLVGALVTIFFGALQSLSSSADSRDKSRRIKELEARNRQLSDENQKLHREKERAAATATSSTAAPADQSPFSSPTVVDEENS
ncbi:MAG: bZIP transcription factor [Candidatus Dadabacteria bacterium]|nr:bZIP transcription factor [Candidatus Dadabacteria bacterium]